MLPAGAGDRIVDFWQDLKPEMEGTDELGGFQVLEIRSSLPDELLMYADKISMAHGLEVRVPYLDKEVVEFAERLPATFKVRWGQRKWLHRRVCERFLPKEILARKKRGFAVNVVDQWFDSSMDSKLSGLSARRHVADVRVPRAAGGEPPARRAPRRPARQPQDALQPGRAGGVAARELPATLPRPAAPEPAALSARCTGLTPSVPPCHLTYVLITPARNEADFIEKTIQSVVAQTVLPLRWIIVSDGSTDGTDEIVEKYLPGRPWLELVTLPPRSERNFAAKVNAFRAG